MSLWCWVYLHANPGLTSDAVLIGSIGLSRSLLFLVNYFLAWCEIGCSAATKFSVELWRLFPYNASTLQTIFLSDGLLREKEKQRCHSHLIDYLKMKCSRTVFEIEIVSYRLWRDLHIVFSRVGMFPVNTLNVAWQISQQSLWLPFVVTHSLVAWQ